MDIILGIATILGGIVAIWFIWEKFAKKEDSTEVTNSWWESSSLKSSLEKKGYEFRWSNTEKIQERLSNGYKIIFHESFFSKKKLKNSSGQILIGKIKNK